METDKSFVAIRNDLRRATVKEIVEIIRLVNAALKSHIPTKGRKDEVIGRFAYYIAKLVVAEKEGSLNTIVRIVNGSANKSLSWSYENNQLLLKANRLEPNTIEDPEELSFKPSPFFSPVTKLCSIKVCPISSNLRHTRRFQFTLSDDSRQLLASHGQKDDRSAYQVRFYCGRFEGDYYDLSVEFPAVCELKVNGTTLPGSVLRCLKGKPGTVNPPDITIMTRKRELNVIDLVYINNPQQFIATVFLVKRTTISELIDIMKQDSVLSKEEVLEKLEQKQEEDEIIMESETLSMKDPLAFTRINLPIRSKSCNHLQCFDANIYLTMNEQTPTWTCPVCYRPIVSWKDLVIDSYFAEILANTPKHINSVLVEPNGNITIVDENPDLADATDSEDEDMEREQQKEKEVVTIVLDDDDDEEEAVEEEPPLELRPFTSRPAPRLRRERRRESTSSERSHQEQANAMRHSIPTIETVQMNGNKRAKSSSAERQQNKKQKKTSSLVVDLTLDSDDDEGPIEMTSRESSNAISQERQETTESDVQEEEQITESIIQEEEQIPESIIQEEEQIPEGDVQKEEQITESVVQEEEQITESIIQEEEQISESVVQEEQETAESDVQQEVQQETTESNSQEQQETTESDFQEQQQTTESLPQESSQQEEDTLILPHLGTLYQDKIVMNENRQHGPSAINLNVYKFN